MWLASTIGADRGELGPDHVLNTSDSDFATECHPPGDGFWDEMVWVYTRFAFVAGNQAEAAYDFDQVCENGELVPVKIPIEEDRVHAKIPVVKTTVEGIEYHCCFLVSE